MSTIPKFVLSRGRPWKFAFVVLASMLALFVGCSQRDAGVCAIAISSDGKSVAVATNNGYIAVQDVATKRRMCRMSLTGQAGSTAKALAFAGKDDLLVSGDWLVKDHWFAPGGDTSITFWEVPRGSPRRVFSHMAGDAIAVSPDRQQIAVGAGGPIFLFGIRAGEIVQRTLDTSLNHVTSLSFSADGRQLVAASRDYRVADSDQWSTWNVKTGEQLAHAAIHTESMLFDATFTSDGASVVFVGNKEKRLRYFDAQTGEQQKEVPWEDGYRALSVSADHRRMASCGHGSSGVMLWDVDTGKKITAFGAKQHFSHVAISPDGRTIAAARAGGNNFDGIEIWHYEQD